MAQKRLANRGTRDHREGGRIEHGIGDVFPLAAHGFPLDDALGDLLCRQLEADIWF